MHHAFIDVYAGRGAPLNKVNARRKIVLLAGFLFLLVISPLRAWWLFLFYGLITAVLFYLSGLPFVFLLKRVAEMLPFVFIIALSGLFRKDGLTLFLGCTLKAVLALVLLLVISGSTKFSELLEALGQLKAPRLFIRLLAFMYRYSFLLEDQFLRAQRAYALRRLSRKRGLSHARVLGNIVGLVFIRTYERAERVYLAMCARGYDDAKNN